jgi:hypothetical protein
LTPLARPVDLLITLAVAVLWVFATRWLWRARVFERYLGVDWEAQPCPDDRRAARARER